MRKILALLALIAATAVMVAAAASAGPAATKQRITIEMRGQAHAWVMKPTGSGSISPDSGLAVFCCYSVRNVVRDGQAIEINDPKVTLVGKHGNFVIRNRIEWVNIPDGWAVANMTWKVISGTGDYAGVTGSGRGSGVTTSSAKLKARFEGFLSSK